MFISLHGCIIYRHFNLQNTGTSILPVISIDYEDYGPTLGLTSGQKQGFFMLALALIAIGTGGIKSNAGPFGAQQLADLGEGPVKSFFNW